MKKGNLSPSIEELQEEARLIRRDILVMLAEAGSGHPGGSLSEVEILLALYRAVMNHRPHEPWWSERDRFILSKGHAVPGLYAVLARCGYFPRELLATLRKPGSPLQGHPHFRSVPGVEASTGSLGQGFSFAVGMALALRLDRNPAKVFVLLGDGELGEGQVWEAAASASHYRLGNIIAILDHNGLQIEGRCSDVLCMEPIEEKFRAFGWETRSVDGHDLRELIETLAWARDYGLGPVFVRARTVKGKGVSFMEDDPSWHGIAPSKEQLDKALKEL
ncbi:MAG: transketolase [candidate division WOR-3 bacterium]